MQVMEVATSRDSLATPCLYASPVTECYVALENSHLIMDLEMIILAVQLTDGSQVQHLVHKFYGHSIENMQHWTVVYASA